MMSAAVVPEVVRSYFEAPYGSVDPHVRAGNRCIITVCRQSFVAYGEGTLEHGPRRGEPPTTDVAEGQVRFFANDCPGPPAMGPFTPLEPITVTIKLVGDRVTMELRSDPFAAPIFLEIIGWTDDSGLIVGTGTWSSFAALFLIHLGSASALPEGDSTAA